jgi:hypothetical protein
MITLRLRRPLARGPWDCDVTRSGEEGDLNGLPRTLPTRLRVGSFGLFIRFSCPSVSRAACR